MVDHHRHSGRRSLPVEELRTHCISVRLNPAELSELDSARGHHTRGEAVRLSLFNNLPAPVPEINSDLRSELGRCLGNLATVAVVARSGDYIEGEEVRKLVVELRSKLIGC